MLYEGGYGLVHEYPKVWAWQAAACLVAQWLCQTSLHPLKARGAAPLPPTALLCVQLTEMSLEEMEMPGQHLPAPDAPDMVSMRHKTPGGFDGK